MVKMTAISTRKAALRKEIAGIIAKLSAEDKSRQSRKVFEKLCLIPEYYKSKRISVYLSTKDEIDTVPILQHIFEVGKEAFVPRYKGKQMQMVKLHSLEDYANLPLTKWNIKQPNFHEPRENALNTDGLDLIVLPGVAFTSDGKRLGHGMGYYDRFLNQCIGKQAKKPYLIGVAFNEQIRDDVPTTEHDVLLDLILSEN